MQLPPQGDLGASVTSPTSVGFLAWVTASFSCLTPCPRLCLVRVCGASDLSPVILVSKHVCATPLVLSLFFSCAIAFRFPLFVSFVFVLSCGRLDISKFWRVLTSLCIYVFFLPFIAKPLLFH